MNPSEPKSKRLLDHLSPLLFLSSHWLSLLGVVLVTTSSILWVFTLPMQLRGHVENPYIGILTFLILPSFFFAGLFLIPIGVLLTVRDRRRKGIPPLRETDPEARWAALRKLAYFVGATTLVNAAIGSQVTYRGFQYMESVQFCGQTCHTVMKPEFTAYQGSPHSRVECVACHIGPGASWFVKSKLSGLRQVYAVTFHTYSTPIPTPVRDLRPSRETCEVCHWPQKYGGDRVRIVPHFGEDEANSGTKTVLMMRIGGGRRGGIHGAHMAPGVEIRYAYSDTARQVVPWVEYNDSTTGKHASFLASDTKPEAVKNMPVRVMDCIDCHNRPTHTYELPDKAVDRALDNGDIPRDLPFIRKQSVEILKADYKTSDEATAAIPAAVKAYYQKTYPAIYAQRPADIDSAARAVLAIFDRNVFPEMKVKWGTYPNNIGHTDSPGCFRCHDGSHSASDGNSITQDCNACHQTLAMEEAKPEILATLGIVDPSPTGKQ